MSSAAATAKTRNAGYGLANGVLVPYRGVIIFSPSMHATLQNVIKRTFGTWKKGFQTLKNAVDYDLDTQCNLVFSLGVIHNFSIQHTGSNGNIFFDLQISWCYRGQWQGGCQGSNYPESATEKPPQQMA
ncbi:uncharacterized protein VP01_4236g2 [Puccinia sorghi]|uniref:DDE Tnp4 domain-containing protein n=1 Tax=Puccinia sorghi TaxID=27349 RepID=A0A0L6UQH5_9BASI|nr:uncharacterized protein VP01_4236g2 [Puccinia sorghi]